MADSAFLKALIKAKTFAWASSFGRIVSGRAAAEALDSALTSASGFVPVGTILPWFGFNGTVAVPANFKLCDGSVVSDADSPINGKTLPNLNTGATDPIFLGGYTAPGNTPTLVNSAMPTHAHAATGTVAGITGNIDTKGAVQGAAGSAVVILNGGGVAQGVGTGSTAGPDRGTNSNTDNWPHHMKVTFIIRIK